MTAGADPSATRTADDVPSSSERAHTARLALHHDGRAKSAKRTTPASPSLLSVERLAVDAAAQRDQMGSVKVVVIGAGGLVGLRMIEELCSRTLFHVGPNEQLPLSCISLFDMNPVTLPPCAKADKRVEVTVGDMTCRATLDRLLTPNGATRVTTIQLAALLSGYAEQNFDLGMRVNLQGAITIMEAVRAVGVALGRPQIYVFTSTDYVACYNGHNRAHPVSEESFRLSPVSYGCQKACAARGRS